MTIPVLGPHVQEEHYELIDPQESIYLPSTWEALIEPGDSVAMRMWPPEFLPKATRAGANDSKEPPTTQISEDQRKRREDRGKADVAVEISPIPHSRPSKGGK
jgi:hypothetical protein